MTFPDHLKSVGFREHVENSIKDLVGSPMLFQLFNSAKEWIEGHPFSISTERVVTLAQDASSSSKSSPQTVCRFFAQGACKYGSKCRNCHHDPKSKASPSKQRGSELESRQYEDKLISSLETKESFDVKAESNPLPQESDSRSRKEDTKKQSMRTASDVISRILWDPDLRIEEFTVGYLDRFVGVIEKSFSAFSWEDLSSVGADVLAVPKHRIQYFKYQQEIVWDKTKQLDNVFGSRGGKLIQDVVEVHENESNSNNTKACVEELSKASDGIGVSASERSVHVAKVRAQEDRPTHFICVHVTSEEVLSNVQHIQGRVIDHSPHLADCCLPLTALHVTVCMVKLENSSQLEIARGVLENTRHNFVQYLPKSAEITFTGVDNFHDRLIYTKVAPNASLDRFSSFLINQFRRAGLKTPGNHTVFTPHMTLVKMSRPMQHALHTSIINHEAYSQFRNMYIGKQCIGGIYLCSMTESKQDDGFYKRLHFVSNSLINMSPLIPSILSKCVHALQQSSAILDGEGETLIKSIMSSGADTASFDKSVEAIHKLNSSVSNPLGVIVVVLRGLPGSGKSHLSRNCLEKNVFICSADDFFTKSGHYDFSHGSLSEAHSQCFENFLHAINDGKEVVVVDNTNSMMWEYRNYIYLCELLGIQHHILEIPHPNQQIISAYSARNLHKVDMASIKSYTERWEEDKRAMLVPPKLVYLQPNQSVEVSEISLLNLCRPGYLPRKLLASSTTLVPVYTGIFLTPKSQWKLVSSFTPTHPKIHADHITLIFEPPLDLINSTDVGKKVSVRVKGLVDSSEVQVVTVDLPEGLSSENETPHVTISTEEKSAPKLANMLLHSQPAASVSHQLKLNGVIGLVVKEMPSSKSEFEKHLTGSKFHTVLSKKHFSDAVLPRLVNGLPVQVPCASEGHKLATTETIGVSIRTGVQKVTELYVFDFDGTLFDTPDPALGRQLYEESTGHRWPHKGWLRRPESLLPPLKIKPGPTLADYHRHIGRAGSYTAILTARINWIREAVRTVLDDHQVHPDQLILKPEETRQDSPEFKVQVISKLLKQFPDIELLKFWDDREDNLQAMKHFSKRPQNNKVKFEIINSTAMIQTIPTLCNEVSQSTLGSHLATCGLLPTAQHIASADTGLRFIATQFCSITGFKGDPSAITLVFGSHALGRQSDVDVCLLAPPGLTHSDCIEKLAEQLDKCGITHIHKGYSSRCPRLKVMLHFQDTPSVDYDIVFAILSSSEAFTACEQSSNVTGNPESLLTNGDPVSKTALTGAMLLHKVREAIGHVIPIEAFGAVVEMAVQVLTAQREKSNFYHYLRTFHIVILLADCIKKNVVKGMDCDSLFDLFVTHVAQLTSQRWQEVFEDYVPIAPEYIPRFTDVFKTLSEIIKQRHVPLTTRYEQMMTRPAFPPSKYTPIWLQWSGGDSIGQWKLKTLLEAKLPTFIRQLLFSGLEVVLDGNGVHSSFCFAVPETKSTKTTLRQVFRKFWNEFSEFQNQKDVRLELKFSRSLEQEEMSEDANSVSKQVKEFASGDLLELHLPATLSSYERLLVHETAERLGVNHNTVGEGSNRHVHLFK